MDGNSTAAFNNIGFRVASLSVPEPTTLLLLMLGMASLICRRTHRSPRPEKEVGVRKQTRCD